MNLILSTVESDSIDLDNPYELLGIDVNANISDITRAFRRLSKQHHPDVGGDKVFYQKLSFAYDLLKDVERRAAYDFSKFDKEDLNTLVLSVTVLVIDAHQSTKSPKAIRRFVETHIKDLETKTNHLYKTVKANMEALEETRSNINEEGYFNKIVLEALTFKQNKNEEAIKLLDKQKQDLINMRKLINFVTFKTVDKPNIFGL